MNGIDHDKTKEQQKMLSNQLIVGIELWESAALALLSELDHGIPSIAEILLQVGENKIKRIWRLSWKQKDQELLI